MNGSESERVIACFTIGVYKAHFNVCQIEVQKGMWLCLYSFANRSGGLGGTLIEYTKIQFDKRVSICDFDVSCFPSESPSPFSMETTDSVGRSGRNRGCADSVQTWTDWVDPSTDTGIKSYVIRPGTFLHARMLEESDTGIGAVRKYEICFVQNILRHFPARHMDGGYPQNTVDVELLPLSGVTLDNRCMPQSRPCHLRRVPWCTRCSFTISEILLPFGNPWVGDIEIERRNAGRWRPMLIRHR